MIRRLQLGFTLAIVAVILIGCGGGVDDRATTTPAPSSPVAQQKLSPGELGDQIGNLYVAALKDVTEILKDRPEAPQVRARVQELKETNVRKLVELGKLREALDASGRSTVDAAIRQKFDVVARESWYATYNSLQQYYLSRDQDFQKLVASFNIITQYANFDLLKRQEPAEAKRLGID